jgi:ABC-2 type transport system permease protein
VGALPRQARGQVRGRQDRDPAIDGDHARRDGRRRPVGDGAGHQRRLAPQSRVYYSGFDPTQEALTGLIVAGLTAGVFGALLITGEYSSGTIRTTLAATPRRPILLAAKIGVTAAAMVVFCELLSFVSFFLGEAILSGGGAPSANLGSPGALPGRVHDRPVYIPHGPDVLRFRAHLFVAPRERSRLFVGVVFVLPLVMHGISEPDVRYTPTNILINSIMATVKQGPGGIIHDLSPAVGLLLMALYAAIALAAGAVLFVKRDA